VGLSKVRTKRDSFNKGGGLNKIIRFCTKKNVVGETPRDEQSLEISHSKHFWKVFLEYSADKI